MIQPWQIITVAEHQQNKLLLETRDVGNYMQLDVNEARQTSCIMPYITSADRTLYLQQLRMLLKPRSRLRVRLSYSRAATSTSYG